MKNEKPEISGNSRQDESAFIETATAGVIIAGGKFAFDVGKSVYRALRANEPLLLKVHNASFSDGRHLIQFELTNGGLHSVYIESLTITKPKKLSFEFWRPPEQMEFGGTNQPKWEKFSPFKIHSEKTIRVNLSVDEVEKSVLHNPGCINMLAKLHILGLPGKHDYRFSLGVRK